MDKNTQPTINKTLSLYAPAQLWVGSHEILVAHGITFLQQIFCLSACTTCITCKQIAQQQYHASLWLHPEKQQYTVDDLTPVFNTLAFAQEDLQHFFIIIQKAELLSVACANRLLKSIEEPPAGYHFILLSRNAEQVLTTIRSRCILQMIGSATARPSEHSALYEIFTLQKTKNPTLFLQVLEKSKITERETVELLEYLLHYWIEQYKKSLEEQEQHHAFSMINILEKALQYPPMPGGSKLFWKNLFLQID